MRRAVSQVVGPAFSLPLCGEGRGGGICRRAAPHPIPPHEGEGVSGRIWRAWLTGAGLTDGGAL